MFVFNFLSFVLLRYSLPNTSSFAELQHKKVNIYALEGGGCVKIGTMFLVSLVSLIGSLNNKGIIYNDITTN